MDIHDYLHRVNGVIPMVGIKSFIIGNYDVWLAHLRMAYDKSGMGGFRHVYQFGNSTYFSYIAHTWISKIKQKGKQLNGIAVYTHRYLLWYFRSVFAEWSGDIEEGSKKIKWNCHPSSKSRSLPK